MTHLTHMTPYDLFLVSLRFYYCLFFMWKNLGRFILKNRVFLLLFLAAMTGFMAWQASKVQINYDFSKAIPVNNPKYKAYQEFRKKFGEDGNLFVIGIQTPKLFEEKTFKAYAQLVRDLKKVRGV